MNQILATGQNVRTESSDMECTVTQWLGGGGQGEVYRATVGGSEMALKWYYPAQASAAQRDALETLVRKGAPTDRFLWPLELVSAPETPGFGYLMPLRAPHFKSIVDLMKGRTEPSFRALALAGLGLAHSFLQLHARGLCYRDISFGNVFFDPESGDILICDNDNVTVDDGSSPGGVLGTPRFMAPEVVRGEAVPSTQTDLYSLAVLLFYMLMVHHPLEGKKEAEIRCFDLPAMNRLYGTDPLFIFDPATDANRPIAGYHDNALAFWPVYPTFIRELFTRAFTDGIRDPLHGRVRESEWRAGLARLVDSIIYCADCTAENFYDIEALDRDGNSQGQCWSCDALLTLPARIRLDPYIVMLNHDTRLFPHHVDEQTPYDFSAPVAAVRRHPSDPTVWGLQNLSPGKWTVMGTDGSVKDVEPGRSISLARDLKINFGTREGTIRL